MKIRTDIAVGAGLIGLIIFFFWLNMIVGDVVIPRQDVIALLKGGEVENPAWSFIVESRLNRSWVAVFAGGALGVSGLILQVFFRNPLAGPGVLGITSGASLGVALIVLGGASMGSFLGNFTIIFAGIVGALCTLFLLLILSRYIQSSITLLVTGLMFSYFTSALTNILFLWANEMDTRSYIIWGLGSFQGLSQSDLRLFCGTIFVTILGTVFLIKPLNALVTGTEYAASVGIPIRRAQTLIIVITGVLAAVVTVYCGPIGFIGIAVPQLVRLLIQSTNHTIIIPIVFLGGAFLALFSDFMVRLSSNNLPLNTVTALIGAPIIIGIIIKINRRNATF